MVSGALNHMNGRVYDPTIGRFLSPDPLVQAPNNTQSYNRYSYVWNNPLSYTDPTGYEINEVVVTAEQTGGGCDGCSFDIDLSGGIGGVSGIGAPLLSGVIAVNHNNTVFIPDKKTQRKAKRRARETGKDQVITKDGKVKSLSRQDSKAYRSVAVQKIIISLSGLGQKVVGTAKVINQVALFFSHFKELAIGNEVQSPMPDETEAALQDVMQSPVGDKIREAGKRIRLVLTRNAADSFLVGDDGSIYYHTDLAGYFAAWREWSIPGDGSDTATLGSQLAHEIGHVIGTVHEIGTVRNFENPYRKYMGMPLRRSYWEEGDVFKY